MSGKESTSIEAMIAGAFGGLFVGAAISDSIGGGKIIFIVIALIIGLIITAVVDTVMNLANELPIKNKNNLLRENKQKAERIIVGECPSCNRNHRVRASAIKSEMNLTCKCGKINKIQISVEQLSKYNDSKKDQLYTEEINCHKCKWTGARDELHSNSIEPEKYIYCPSCGSLL